MAPAQSVTVGTIGHDPGQVDPRSADIPRDRADRRDRRHDVQQPIGRYRTSRTIRATMPAAWASPPEPATDLGNGDDSAAIASPRTDRRLVLNDMWSTPVGRARREADIARVSNDCTACNWLQYGKGRLRDAPVRLFVRELRRGVRRGAPHGRGVGPVALPGLRRAGRPRDHAAAGSCSRRTRATTGPTGTPTTATATAIQPRRGRHRSPDEDPLKLTRPSPLPLLPQAVIITGEPKLKPGSLRTAAARSTCSSVTRPAVTASARICSKFARWRSAPGKAPLPGGEVSFEADVCPALVDKAAVEASAPGWVDATLLHEATHRDP